MLPDDRFYTENHFWLRLENDEITLGLTPRGADDLGELNFAELAQPGQTVQEGQSLGVVESVKSVQELLCPCDGTVVESNALVVQNPEIVNESPLERGWLLKIRPSQDFDGRALLSSEAYTQKWPQI